MAHDPEFDRPTLKSPSRLKGWVIRGVVSGGIVLVLIALFLPATRSSRGAARRSQCINNLKQIALALHNYEVQYGALPPAYTIDAGGRPLHSWRTLILPFIDSAESIYAKVDLTKPWNDPANAEAARAMPAIYHCSELLDHPNATTYLAMVGPDACFLPSQPRRLAEITHGTASTLMLIEAGSDDAVPWMAPRDADEKLFLAIDPTTNLDHVGGTNTAFVSGEVRFLRRTESLADRRAMVSITEGGSAGK